MNLAENTWHIMRPPIKEIVMNFKVEVVTVIIQALQSKTDVLTTPSTFDNWISTFCTGYTIEQRRAMQTVATIEEIVDAAKKMNTNRKFKKIVQNY